MKINGADPDFHRRDLWDAIQPGRLPGVGARAAALRRRVRRQPSTSTCSTRPSSSPRRSCRCAASAGWCSTACVDNFFAETEQVAFCTQNIVPGIDFTNDPLLQGRNFSYLDTQLKRLGGPNFTHLPINAPKCPFAHFQQDGHMAMHQPDGPGQLRAQLWGRRVAARARIRSAGFQSFPEEATGPKQRVRGRRASPTTTARPASSYVSQTADRAEATSPTRSSSSSARSRARPSAAAWSPICAMSTRTFAQTVADGPRPGRAARRAAGGPRDDRAQAVAGAEHHRQRTGELRRPQARRPGDRRRRRRRSGRAALSGRGGRGRNVELIAPAVGGVTSAATAR